MMLLRRRFGGSGEVISQQPRMLSVHSFPQVGSLSPLDHRRIMELV
jgi:hypothetical protein